ncbi:DUF4649 family protein [Streptococcus caviae]|uniref:DUF4649 family protein n=1 Tax=Streptococcus sp. 'caviae' TaxID=1915004 RepID=UPI00094BB59C|nr:DUF4649 family protein [Streptococcus sp. 'caviae']OLN83784.1 DUF4649 domain-containing protein [Streptococcus sp. 'caviae']
MIVLTYLDAYQTKRESHFNSPEEFMLSLSGCVTLPDSYQVVSLTYKGQDVGYKGAMGDLYRTVSQMDWRQFESN